MELSRPVIDTDILSERLEAMLHAGRSSAARPLLQALQRLQEPNPRLAGFEARLLLAEGRAQEALEVLDRAIAAAPETAHLHKCRAGVQVELGNIAAAADDAAQAVILDPADAGAKKMLGVLLVTLDRAPDAITCLREALTDDPRSAAHYRGLAMAQDHTGDDDAAAVTLALGIAACPRDVELREAAIMLALRRRDFAQAVAHATQARRDGCVNATVFVLLGHASASLGEHAAAADAYREALKLAPADPQIRRLASSGLPHDGDRTPPEQVRGMFDFYADHFDEHIISLGYRIPGLVRAALSDRLADLPPSPALLDLGCGTGLLAVAVGDQVGPITGVDISPAMLALAAAKGLYTELFEADLLTWLDSETRQWPIVVAADVLIYFGALAPLFRAVHARLQPGGIFLFSLEAPAHPTAAGQGWSLGRLGRFGHDASYVTSALAEAGLALERMEPQGQRVEAGSMVPGWLVAARRPA